MDAWYRHFEMFAFPCDRLPKRTQRFSRKERVRRGAFDIHSLFTKQEAMACPTLTSLVRGRILSCSISSAAYGAKQCWSGGSVAGA